jgi:hypothetical protein
MSLAQKAYDKRYNTLVKVEAYGGVSSSNGGDTYEVFLSGILAEVTTKVKVSSVAPSRPKKK